MTKTQLVILAVLAMGMVAIAMALGNWAQQINPDGIAAHPAGANTEVDANSSAGTGAAEKETVEDPDRASASAEAGEPPRNAFSFGVSMGLLGTGLLYCCIAFGLFIGARSRGRSVGPFVYWVAGLAGLGFVLSYLIDDYFY